MSDETETLIRAAQILAGKGIHLVARGCWDISPNELRTFLADEDQWEADCYGVSKEQMTEFHRYGWPRCAAITKRGSLCKNKPSDCSLGYGPEWFFEWHCEGYCRIHGG